jgi:2-polyprenyl-6-methoxyphenol hydroxylase-like FAD-dependent oxidoreductase
VVVGARCAGAALAQRLATAGLSVALLDAAKQPSDQRTSTHLIHPPGTDELDALGVTSQCQTYRIAAIHAKAFIVAACN